MAESVAAEESSRAVSIASKAETGSLDAQVVSGGGGLKGRALKGSLWVFGSYGAQQALRFGSNVVLSHLLFPEAFGVIALANVFMYGLTMISDVGIQQSVIQHARGEEREFQDTAWTLQVLRGLVLFVLASAIARPYAALYSEPDLFLITVAVSLSTVFDGFSSTKLVLLQRRVELSKVALIDLCCRTLSVAVMLVWAWLEPTVWALAAGALVGRGTRMICSYLLIAGPTNRFRWDPRYLGEILTFGKWIFASSLISFVATRTDILLMGKLFSLNLLGVYNVALMLTFIPGEISGRVATQVLFPALAEAGRQDTTRLRDVLRRFRGAVLSVAGLTVVSIAIGAPVFFGVLYDARYHDAGLYAQLLCVVVWLGILRATASRALVALGDTRALPRMSGADFLGSVGGSLAGYALGDAEGFILGLAMGPLLSHAVVQVALGVHGISTTGQDLRFTAWVAGLSLVGGVGTRLGLAHFDGTAAILGAAALWGLLVLGAPAIVVAIRLRRLLG